MTTRFCGIHWRFENLKMLLLHFFFLPIQKAKCYHGNGTMLKMSVLHST